MEELNEKLNNLYKQIESLKNDLNKNHNTLLTALIDINSNLIKSYNLTILNYNKLKNNDEFYLDITGDIHE